MCRVILATLAVTILAACQPQTAELTEEQKAAIADTVIQVRAELVEVNERLDADAFLSFFADYVVVAKELNVMDYDAFAAEIREDFGTYDHYVIEEELIKASVLSEDAVAVTDRSMWYLIATSGDTIWTAPATFTLVFVRRNEQWKIVNLHAAWVDPNSD